MKNKLMIVDDDPDVLVAVRYIFEDEGFEVYTVDNGRDCLEELERGFKGIVLMDIMMPFISGWDTIQAIVNNGFTHDVKILIMSVKGWPDDAKARELEPYVQGYIPKPFDAEHLVSIVTQFLPSAPSIERKKRRLVM